MRRYLYFTLVVKISAYVRYIAWASCMKAPFYIPLLYRSTKSKVYLMKSDWRDVNVASKFCCTSQQNVINVM